MKTYTPLEQTIREIADSAFQDGWVKGGRLIIPDRHIRHAKSKILAILSSKGSELMTTEETLEFFGMDEEQILEFSGCRTTDNNPW